MLFFLFSFFIVSSFLCGRLQQSLPSFVLTRGDPMGSPIAARPQRIEIGRSETSEGTSHSNLATLQWKMQLHRFGAPAQASCQWSLDAWDFSVGGCEGRIFLPLRPPAAFPTFARHLQAGLLSFERTSKFARVLVVGRLTHLMLC